MEKKKAKKLTKKQKEELARANRKRAALERRQRAIELYQNGGFISRISEELKVSRPTIIKWLDETGIERRSKVGKEEEDEQTEDIFEEKLAEITDSLKPADEMLAARTAEEQALMEVAQNQATPADQYQAYIAANAIKMLRDNIFNVRGPRTIKELSDLDQLIRRSLGLDPKGNKSAGGTLTIDINVLNNTKADLSRQRTVVEAETVDGEDDE